MQAFVHIAEIGKARQESEHEDKIISARVYMKDWIQKLDDFLRLSGKELLQHAGTISAELAKKKANLEYDEFKKRISNQLSPVEIDFIENFEKEQKKLRGK